MRLESRNQIWLFLFVCTSLFFFWNLQYHDVVDVNEGMRLVPAIEMLESGDWVVPRIQGDPYIKKPPFTYWTILAHFLIFPGHHEVVGRVPFALSGILCVLGLAWIGSRKEDGEIEGITPGLLAGMFLATTYYFLHKAQKANIDVPMVLFMAGGVYFFGQAVRREWRRMFAPLLVASVCFGIAAFFKGPVYLPYVLACLITAIIQDRRKWLRYLPAALACLLAPLVIVLPWALRLIDALGWETVWGVFNHEAIELRLNEATEINSGPIWHYLLHAPGASMPWSLLLLAWLHPGFRAYAAEKSRWLLRYSAIFSLVSLVIFSLMPGKEVEYLLTIFPFIMLNAGHAFFWLWGGKREQGQMAKGLVYYLAAIAGLGCLTPAAMLYTEFGQWILLSHSALVVFLAGMVVSAVAVVSLLRHGLHGVSICLAILSLSLTIAGYRDTIKPREKAMRSAALVAEFVRPLHDRGVPVYRYRGYKVKHAHMIWHLRDVSEPLRSNVEDADDVLRGHDYALVVLRKKYLDDCRRDFEGMFSIREIMADPEMVPDEGYEYTVVVLQKK
ncbi:MAG: ArnT family glycosyltransferase [Candidatus Sumerlaeia bacterium]